MADWLKPCRGHDFSHFNKAKKFTEINILDMPKKQCTIKLCSSFG